MKISFLSFLRPTLVSWSKVVNQDDISLAKETACQINVIDLIRFSHWDTYKVREGNGYTIQVIVDYPTFSMVDKPSLVLSLDASPTYETKELGRCATTTSVTTNGSACLKDASSFHHDLSTLRLLAAHIGYVHLLYITPSSHGLFSVLL